MADSIISTTIRLGGAFLIGALPFANIVARLSTDQDLRSVGNGTVSTSAVYRIADLRSFAVSCALDVSKGVLAVSLADERGPALVAAAAGFAVAGHNWSPFLRGAGGRGVLPGVGALLVTAPSGAALLLGGLATGRAASNTGLGCFTAQVLLVPWLAWTRGKDGVMLGTALVLPMLLKRVLGNGRPARSHERKVYLTRMLYDRDLRPGAREFQLQSGQTGSTRP
jgi:glycerol-3-phosphate acyltransferase PlsY